MVLLASVPVKLPTIDKLPLSLKTKDPTVQLLLNPTTGGSAYVTDSIASGTSATLNASTVGNGQTLEFIIPGTVGTGSIIVGGTLNAGSDTNGIVNLAAAGNGSITDSSSSNVITAGQVNLTAGTSSNTGTVGSGYTTPLELNAAAVSVNAYGSNFISNAYTGIASLLQSTVGSLVLSVPVKLPTIDKLPLSLKTKDPTVDCNKLAIPVYALLMKLLP